MDGLSAQVEKLVDGIVQAVHPLEIILFGSVVRGGMSLESDVDVLVVMPEGTHRRHTAQRLYGVIEGVSIPFDLVVATPSDLERHRNTSGLVYSSVLREGKTVYAA